MKQKSYKIKFGFEYPEIDFNYGFFEFDHLGIKTQWVFSVRTVINKIILNDEWVNVIVKDFKPKERLREAIKRHAIELSKRDLKLNIRKIPKELINKIEFDLEIFKDLVFWENVSSIKKK